MNKFWCVYPHQKGMKHKKLLNLYRMNISTMWNNSVKKLCLIDVIMGWEKPRMQDLITQLQITKDYKI